MKILLSLLLLSFFSFVLKSQDLIINGDFETLKNNFQKQGNTKVSPENWTSINSIDVYSNSTNISNIDCKTKSLSSQSGDKYIGFTNFDRTTPNYREYIIGTLKRTLKKIKNIFYVCILPTVKKQVIYVQIFTSFF